MKNRKNTLQKLPVIKYLYKCFTQVVLISIYSLLENVNMQLQGSDRLGRGMKFQNVFVEFEI